MRNVALCYLCEREVGAAPFLYCDSSRDEFLVVWPDGKRERARELIDYYVAYLERTPLELRGGKERIEYIEGVPVVVFDEDNVAAITLCSEAEFGEVVNDDVLYEVGPWINGDREMFREYQTAMQLSERGQWLSGAAAFARVFLREPYLVDVLRNIGTCLRRMEREGDAKRVAEDEIRLRAVLRQHGIIRRLVRRGVPSVGDETEWRARILTEGLPETWGFEELLWRLRTLAESK